MILQVFGFALLFLVFGIIAIAKKKKVLGWFAVLLALFTTALGLIAIYFYPHILPF